MFKLIASIAVSAVILTGVSAAFAGPSEASCRETAETNYQIAIAIDFLDADMVHEDTMVECWESQRVIESDSETEADSMLAGPLALLAR